LSVSTTYWIAGAGRMGLAIGSLIAESGAASTLLLIGRKHEPPEHRLMSLAMVAYERNFPGAPAGETVVVLAVPDGAVHEVAGVIAALGSPGPACVALHLSGALPAGALTALDERGYAVGSLHPLQTVAEPAHGAERLRGSFFAFEGDAAARRAAAEIVRAAAGRMLEVHAEDKARYHAACVFASNYVVACAAVATRLLADAAGIGEEEAAHALRPLWGGAVSNLEQLGPTAALTGPVRRGDIETVRAHLGALEGSTLDLYAELALEAVRIARRAGLNETAAASIERAIGESKSGGSGQR
jgi:predicted short-subunit dehydrogenase-like oxidoreductase (DUF2520 family)